ncbi:uncharacterized protein [Littorina saxatilis]|uniref:uncharacterized protein isoform X2 n=1 Tax=Littorina saxatilis TaxID=31220 RepID=UPI0038B632F0
MSRTRDKNPEDSDKTAEPEGVTNRVGVSSRSSENNVQQRQRLGSTFDSSSGGVFGRVATAQEKHSEATLRRQRMNNYSATVQTATLDGSSARRMLKTERFVLPELTVKDLLKPNEDPYSSSGNDVFGLTSNAVCYKGWAVLRPSMSDVVDPSSEQTDRPNREARTRTVFAERPSILTDRLENFKELYKSYEVGHTSHVSFHQNDEDSYDQLYDVIFDLYSTQERLHTHKHHDDSIEVPESYQRLFKNNSVPLTKHNVETFVHDVGVAVLEKETRARAHGVSHDRSASLSGDRHVDMRHPAASKSTANSPRHGYPRSHVDVTQERNLGKDAHAFYAHIGAHRPVQDAYSRRVKGVKGVKGVPGAHAQPWTPGRQGAIRVPIRDRAGKLHSLDKVRRNTLKGLRKRGPGNTFHGPSVSGTSGQQHPHISAEEAHLERSAMFPMWTTMHEPELVKRVADSMDRRTRTDFSPWTGLAEGPEFPPYMPYFLIHSKTAQRTQYRDLLTHSARRNTQWKKNTKSLSFNEGKPADGEAVILVPANRQLKDFQRDFYKRAQEAAIKRRSLRCRKRWFTGYRIVHTVLRIGQNMAERSAALEASPSTYVDIGDGVTATVDYGNGRSIDTEQFKRRKEISISSRVTDVLTSNPADRTLIQIEEARRELQKVEVFSEYPIDVQEHLIRRAFYVNISPKRIIVRRGHDPLYFYIIICGQAYAKDLEADPVTGEMRAKAAVFLKTGQSFGAAALISGQGHTTTVISRTNMQLLAINGEDYLEAFWYPSLRKELPPRLVYISKMNFMVNFPIHLIKEKLNICTMHHFRRNTVITHDSRKSRNLFIVKFGYCKVFRKLDWQELPMEDLLIFERKKVSHERKTSELIQDIVRQEIYIERESPYVNYYETRSPQGNTVRVPVTRVPRLTDKLQSLPLTLPAGKRQFVPLMLLREGEVFVSLGAEVIALNKDFYCRHAAKEAKEVSDKTFIYDDNFIKRRVRERVNRDVHLEEVLNHYFHKVTMATSELCRTTDVTMI